MALNGVVLLQQDVSIFDINFSEQRISATTRLRLRVPRNFERIPLNCSQLAVSSVTVDDEEAEYDYADPLTDICGDVVNRSISSFVERCAAGYKLTDSELGNGELWVLFPPSQQRDAESLCGGDQDGSSQFSNQFRELTVSIDYVVTQPTAGITFVTSSAQGSLFERAVHVFTDGHQVRSWLPCIDSPGCACLWNLEFQTPSELTAIASGDSTGCDVLPGGARRWTFSVTVPTPARNIGFVVGAFEQVSDGSSQDVSHYALPRLKPLLEHTVSYFNAIMDYYEEVLSVSFPHSSYRQVFVAETRPSIEVVTFATLAIFSVNSLFAKRVIEQTIATRHLMALALAQQYFGCFVLSSVPDDAWLLQGCARFIAALYARRAFGVNEQRATVCDMLKEVCDYEESVCHISLTQRDSELNASKSNSYPLSAADRWETACPMYERMRDQKSYLIVRMLEQQIGLVPLLQVLKKLVSLATQSLLQSSNEGIFVTLSSFLKSVFVVTGKAMADFLQLWTAGGACRVLGTFTYNRKKNQIELNLTQTGSLRYYGPVTVAVQEFDGYFTHRLQLGESITHELTTHSKTRKSRRRKITLQTSEEVELDTTRWDMDTPFLWLHLDPELALYGQCDVVQSELLWQQQIMFDKNISGQLAAARHLVTFNSTAVRCMLEAVLLNECLFYGVRLAAAKALFTLLGENGSLAPAVTVFQTLFGAKVCREIPKRNDFSQLQNYYIQKELPLLLADSASKHPTAAGEVLPFLLNLISLNENGTNLYTDCGYTSALLTALANCISPAVVRSCSVACTAEATPVLDEIHRAANFDRKLPSFKLANSCAALRSLRHLQLLGHVTADPAVFHQFAVPGVFSELRLAALECLTDFATVEQDQVTLSYILSLLSSNNGSLSESLICLLCSRPLFTPNSAASTLNTPELAATFWRLLNTTQDVYRRKHLARLFYRHYGDAELDPQFRPARVVTPPPIKRKSSKQLRVPAPVEVTPVVSHESLRDSSVSKMPRLQGPNLSESESDND